MKLLSNYFRIPKAIGLHINFDEGDDVQFRACNVEAEGHSLNIISKIDNVRSTDEILKKINDPTLPIALVITGRQVLTKIVEHCGEKSDEDIFREAMPGADTKDLCIQVFRSGDRAWLSLIRRSAISPILENLENSGYQVLCVSLDAFPIDPIVPQLNIYGQNVQLDGFLVQRNENTEWIQLSNSPEFKALFPVKIGEEKISETVVLSYAAAFQLVMSVTLQPIRAVLPDVDQRRDQRLLARRYNAIGALALGVLFLLLLINFMLFQHFEKENERLSLQIGQRDRDLFSESKVEERIKVKEALLDSLGYTGGQDHALMVDAMARLLPVEVTWERLSVSPMRSDNNSGLVTKFFDREIHVSGRSAKIIAVNEWVARLQTLKWVHSVRLAGYRFNNELQTGQFDVLLQY